MTTAVFGALDDVLAGVDRVGVVHVGANHGQEVPAYRAAGFDLVRAVEPNPACWPDLDALGVEVLRCAAGPRGEGTLHVTSWDERASMLEPVAYDVSLTLTVDVWPLAMLQAGCNVAVLDCQGSELDVLRTADLDLLDVAIVEVDDRRRYHGAAVAAEVEAFMAAEGWERIGAYGGHSHPALVDVAWRHP